MFGLPDLLQKRGTPRPYISMNLSRNGQTRGAAPTVGGVLNLSPLSTLHSQLTLNTKLSSLIRRNPRPSRPGIFLSQWIVCKCMNLERMYCHRSSWLATTTEVSTATAARATATAAATHTTAVAGTTARTTADRTCGSRGVRAHGAAAAGSAIAASGS